MSLLRGMMAANKPSGSYARTKPIPRTAPFPTLSPVARAVMTLGRETRSRLQAARPRYWTCGRSRHCLTAGTLRCRMLRRGAPERQARGESGRRLRRRGSHGPRADAFKTRREAIDWARKNNHSPLVARVRHLNDEKSPGHWRRVALRNRFPFQAVPLVRPERTPPCYLSHPIPSRRSLTRRTPPSPRVFAMSRTRVPAYAARKPGPVLLTRARTA